MSGLLHGVLELVLFVCLVFGAVKIFAAVVTAAFPRLGSSSKKAPGKAGRGKPRALRSPAPRAVRTAGRSAIAMAAHPTNSQVRTQARADVRRAWESARSTDWLEQRRHERENGTATATEPRRTLRQRLRLAPFSPASASGNGGNGNGATAGGTGSGTGSGAATCPACGWPPATCVCPPASGRPETNGRERPAPPPPPGPGQPSTNGGNVAAGTSTASAEKLIEGINEIHAHAAAGNIHAKREAIKAAHEGSIRFAAMVQMLARQLAEPGSHYGPEITEPTARSGQHHQAAAMSLSEADAALSTLINMSVGELATSPRQAPHHTELSESGAH